MYPLVMMRLGKICIDIRVYCDFAEFYVPKWADFWLLLCIVGGGLLYYQVQADEQGADVISCSK